MNYIPLQREMLLTWRQAAPRFPRRHQKSQIALAIALLLVLTLSLPVSLLAQSQAQSQPQPQSQPPLPKSPQTQNPPVAASSKTKTNKDDSASSKVYTDDDVDALPPGGISVVGPGTPPPAAADSNTKAPAGGSVSPTRTGKGAKAAYWKARYAAARDKLAQDQKALPSLQSQLETERVQQDLVDEDSGQVYSDLFMYLLQKIDDTKLAIQNDQQALSDLDEEFRKAGGLPGWIR
jgi:hypothetical protein